jgi:hypothetical protein
MPPLRNPESYQYQRKPMTNPDGPFFPDEFTRPVVNDSEIFDFDAWVEDGQEKRVGWQNRRTGTTAGYPQLHEPPRGRRIPVTCRAGDILLFSGQHLHQTRNNTTRKTRFSMDFRTVHLKDHADGIEAINVDNQSTGLSLQQFVQGADFEIKERNEEAANG